MIKKFITIPEFIEQTGLTEHKARRIARAEWHGFPPPCGTRRLQNGYKALTYPNDQVQLWIDNHPHAATMRLNFQEPDYHPHLDNAKAQWFIRFFPRPEFQLLNEIA